MSHIISLKVTKFQQPLLITLGVADEKPEGGQKAPPPRDIGLSLSVFCLGNPLRKASLFTNTDIASITGRPTPSENEGDRRTQTNDQIHGSCNQLIYPHQISSHSSKE